MKNVKIKVDFIENGFFDNVEKMMNVGLNVKIIGIMNNGLLNIEISGNENILIDYLKNDYCNNVDWWEDYLDMIEGV